MNKKRLFLLLFFLIFLIVSVFLFIGGWMTPHSKSIFLNLKDKNIILISIDTLRADHLGVYGYHRNTSPFIDQLSRESIVFERAFTASGYTLPSHTSLFTGLYPRTHKVSIFYNDEGGFSYGKTSFGCKI